MGISFEGLGMGIEELIAESMTSTIISESE